MTIQTVSAASGAQALSNSVRAAYGAKYVEAAELTRVYDRLAQPVGKFGVEQAAKLNSSIVLNFLSEMAPGTSALSETTDVVPSVLRDATCTISPTSRWGALQWSEKIELEAYTNYGESRMKVLGSNMMESVDLLAQAKALQGGNAWSFVGRATLDAGGTTGHLLTDSLISFADVRLLTGKCPAYVGNGRNQWFSILHPYAFYDLRTGGKVVSVAYYQKAEIILNWELGQVGNFKLIVSPDAKTFMAAGLANGAAIATTTSGAINALDLTMTVAAGTSIGAGDRLMVGTIETGNTFYPTNETVLVSSIATSTVTIIGAGANGGFKYDHASGSTVSNKDDVFPVVFGGPSSLGKMYAEEIGEFGEVVGPKKDGLLDQFGSIGWKWYGGYDVISQSWLFREEVASSLQNSDSG